MGQRLRLARLRRRLSVTELAARVGASRATIHRLEQGDVSVSLAILLRVLAVLGLEGDLDLIARDDELGQRLQDAALRQPRRRSQPSTLQPPPTPPPDTTTHPPDDH